MSDPRREDDRLIGELIGKVDMGFQGINQRLDTLNGKVATHETRLGTLDTAQAAWASAVRTSWLISGLIMAVLGLLVKWGKV